MTATAEPSMPRAVLAAVTAVAGGGVAVLLGTAFVEVPQVDWTSPALVPAYLFAALLVAGELRPIVVTRDDGDTEAVTVSTTFALALVLTGEHPLDASAQRVRDHLRRPHAGGREPLTEWSLTPFVGSAQGRWSVRGTRRAAHGSLR